jgi:hypothetical protein
MNAGISDGSTYSLMHVDGVLASNDLLDGGLRGLLSLGRHFLQFGKSVLGVELTSVSYRCD